MIIGPVTNFYNLYPPFIPRFFHASRIWQTGANWQLESPAEPMSQAIRGQRNTTPEGASLGRPRRTSSQLRAITDLTYDSKGVETINFGRLLGFWW